MAKKEELFVQAAQEHRAGGAVGSAPLLYGISDRRGRWRVRRRIGIRVVVNPPEIFLPQRCTRFELHGGLKGAPTPVVAIFPGACSRYRLAVDPASDERLARSGLGAVAMMVAAGQAPRGPPRRLPPGEAAVNDGSIRPVRRRWWRCVNCAPRQLVTV